VLKFADLERAIKVMKKRFDRQLGIGGNELEFCPITGREQNAFLDVRDLGQPSKRFGQR